MSEKITVKDFIEVGEEFFDKYYYVARELGEDPKPEEILNVFASGIEYVYDKEQVYDDFDESDSMKFLESLSKEQFDRVTNFYNTMPVSRLEVKYKCEKCGEEVTTKLSGLLDFFT